VPVQSLGNRCIYRLLTKEEEEMKTHQELRYALYPEVAKHYTMERIRSDFLNGKIFNGRVTKAYMPK
jgi:hypothetical protein